MSWNWSHTEEAIQNVQTNIASLDDDTLVEVYAEWSCAQLTGTGYVLIEAKMPLARETARSFIDADARDIIVDAIISKTCHHAECENGGFEAHICPFGCHTVSFDNDNDERFAL